MSDGKNEMNLLCYKSFSLFLHFIGRKECEAHWCTYAANIAGHTIRNYEIMCMKHTHLPLVAVLHLLVVAVIVVVDDVDIIGSDNIILRPSAFYWNRNCVLTDGDVMVMPASDRTHLEYWMVATVSCAKEWGLCRSSVALTSLHILRRAKTVKVLPRNCNNEKGTIINQHAFNSCAHYEVACKVWNPSQTADRERCQRQIMIIINSKCVDVSMTTLRPAENAKRFLIKVNILLNWQIQLCAAALGITIIIIWRNTQKCAAMCSSNYIVDK